MKNLFYLSARLLLLFIILFNISGCRKIYEKFRERDDNPTTCSIKMVQYQVYDYTPQTLRFYNNRNGDPDSVIYDEPGGFSMGSYFYFTYDRLHRLIAFNAYYDRNPEHYYFKHTYVYSMTGKIIQDTLRTNKDQVVKTTTVFKLQYDNQNRVVSEVGQVLESNAFPELSMEPFTIVYEYDARGNIVYSDIGYDEQVNFLRTSDVLMFTERNYSKNNPIGARGYNEQNLPLGFPGYGYNLFATNLWGIFQRNAPSNIEYNCK